MTPAVLWSRDDFSDNMFMALTKITRKAEDDGFLPYTILGMYLGLLPVFTALIINQLTV